MAIMSTLSNNLLKHIILGTDGFSTSTGNYLALLTELPTTPNATSGLQEVPTTVQGYKNGVSGNYSTGYARLKLSNSGSSANGLAGQPYFSSKNGVWDSTNQYCIITNDGDDIQMHNIYEEGVLPRQDAAGTTPFTWTVKGFGIYTAVSGGTLLAYGDIVDDQGYKTTVTLTEGSVPIFYKNGLQLIIADEPATINGGY